MQHRSAKCRTYVQVATKLSNISIIQYNKQYLEKTSVDAHGLSSCLGCSRILWHLISFEDHHRDSNMSHHVTSCHLTPHHFATQPQIVEQACNDCAKPSMKCTELAKCSLNRSNCHCCGHLQVTQVKYWLGRRSCGEVSLKSSWKAKENSVNHEFKVYQSIPRVLKTGGPVDVYESNAKTNGDIDRQIARLSRHIGCVAIQSHSMHGLALPYLVSRLATQSRLSRWWSLSRGRIHHGDIWWPYGDLKKWSIMIWFRNFIIIWYHVIRLISLCLYIYYIYVCIIPSCLQHFPNCFSYAVSSINNCLVVHVELQWSLYQDGS